MTPKKTVQSSRRQRIDLLLVERGLVESRQQAQKYIIAGKVRANNQPVRKSSELFDQTVSVELVARKCDYVSRGGDKLTFALDYFHVDVTDLVCADIGISTGGFTDCLLQRGAKHVFGIDVGYGQVAWTIRQDSRVTLFERTNVRYFDAASLGSKVDLAVIDVSFISVRIILDAVRSLLKKNGSILALIKPQFEAGKGKVGKGGIVKDPLMHDQIMTGMKEFISGKGFSVSGSCDSPITGAKGNKEFFIHFAPRE